MRFVKIQLCNYTDNRFLIIFEVISHVEFDKGHIPSQKVERHRYYVMQIIFDLLLKEE